MTKVRCAIYTRKSSEEGLEQEFNSLDAQYEACKSYVASQRHEGWSLNKDRFDDGGFSGGSMERPGLKALLCEVSAGNVDVVVIYKIDRLTRSLADFARIMDELEKAGASFVSVTQSFNTKTSMGRLMLHVLLSFAQFEREVGAERVRDKVAASKAKGMWMGGTVPLGYDSVDKKLIVNEEEAQTVRAILAKFVEAKSIPATLRWAREQGLKTKSRRRLGKPCGGNLFHYGALRGLLSNRIYVGEIAHKGMVHAGQHVAIIERDLFDHAQAILKQRRCDAALGPKLPSGSLLQGLIIDRYGRTMGPVHTTRNGQRFRYYATRSRTIEDGDPAGYRLSARPLEQMCCDLLSGHLSSQIDSFDSAENAKAMLTCLADQSSGGARQLFMERVAKVTISDGSLTLSLVDGTELNRSIERLRHGNDARLILGESTNDDHKADPQLIKLLKDVYRARMLALANPAKPIDKLASLFGRSTERYRRLLRLSYLSPTIVRAIMSATQPAYLTNRHLQNFDRLPISWSEQEAILLA